MLLCAALLIGCCAAMASQAAEPIDVATGLIGDADEPGARLDGLLIGIDPGHQGQGNYEREPVMPGGRETKAKVSSGTQGVTTKTPEHVVNLEVSMKLRAALEREGATVVMTREAADVDISNIERAVMMNDAGADLVLRIHCNAADSASPKGMALYVRKTGARADECRAAAETILPNMVAATGAQNRGVVRNDSYTGLNWSDVPSILVEMGFMTNPVEDELLGSPEYQDKLVSGMVEGIAEYFGR